jgi:hypothetical protein
VLVYGAMPGTEEIRSHEMSGSVVLPAYRTVRRDCFGGETVHSVPRPANPLLLRLMKAKLQLLGHCGNHNRVAQHWEVITGLRVEVRPALAAEACEAL